MPKSPRDQVQPQAADDVVQTGESDAKKVKVQGEMGETETPQAENHLGKLTQVYNLVEFKYIVDGGSGSDEFWVDGLPSVAKRFEKKIDALRAAVDANFEWYKHVVKSCKDQDREFGGDDVLIQSIQPNQLVEQINDDLGINVESLKVEWERLQKLTVDQLEKLVAIQRDALALCLGENSFQYPNFIGSFWVEKGDLRGGGAQGGLVKAESTLALGEKEGRVTPGEVLDKIARCVGERNLFHIIHQVQAKSESWGEFGTTSQEGREVYATQEAAEKDMASNVPAPHTYDGINEAIMNKAFDGQPGDSSEFETLSSKVEKTVVLFEYSRKHLVGPDMSRILEASGN